MTINKHLATAANEIGYVVKSVENGSPTKFGNAHTVTIQNGEFTVTYTTNVLNGVNYFRITHVRNYLTNRNYSATRYHFRFIPVVQFINSNTFLAMKGDN